MGIVNWYRDLEFPAYLLLWIVAFFIMCPILLLFVFYLISIFYYGG